MTHVTCDCCGNKVNSNNNGKLEIVSEEICNKSLDLCEDCVSQVSHFIHNVLPNLKPYDNVKNFEWCKNSEPKITIP